MCYKKDMEMRGGRHRNADIGSVCSFFVNKEFPVPMNDEASKNNL